MKLNAEADSFILCDYPKLVTVTMARKWLAEKNDVAKEELVNLIYHRLHRRYVVPLSQIPPKFKSGFLIMGVACLLIEALQSFKEGKEYTKQKGAGQKCFEHFFWENDEFSEFRPHVSSFYSGIRCGILHQAETYDGWRIIRKKDALMLEAKVINANAFMEAVNRVLSEYIEDLKLFQFGNPFWDNACKKLGHICDHCEEMNP